MKCRSVRSLQGLAVLGGWLLMAQLASRSEAGIVVFDEGSTKVEIGGRIQLQYRREELEERPDLDELFFRRLRLYVQTEVGEDWEAKVQLDFGRTTSPRDVLFKDVYLRYKGFEDQGLRLTLGSQKPPFSREFLTSSKRLQLVERGFAGNHNFGSPDRMIGLRADGDLLAGKVGWAAGFGQAAIDPQARLLDFDNPANPDTDFNEGWLSVARIDFHPLGAMKLDQGDFDHGGSKVTISAAAFTWSNDGDRNTYTMGQEALHATKVDVDSATGFELSAGYRGHGLSVDGELQAVSSDTVVGSFSGGLYDSGEADLDKLGLTGGYMVFGDDLEVVAGIERFEAKTYATAWKRSSLGLNYFVRRHDLKFQLTYRLNADVEGVPGQDLDEIFVQAQYVF